MGCPDPNTFQSLRDGDLPPPAREAVFDHADGCDDCRQLLAALARTLPAPASGESAEPAARMPASGSLLVKGTTVGRYEIDSFLGAGGLGLVYAARDPDLSRRVALKLLKLGGAAQPQLMREARAMARVSHPNVLTVLDAGVWNERVYLVMELAEGGDLRAWLAARPRGLAEIVDVFRAAGQGLAAAHAAGLVHRDFKPDNVLVSADGRVRVTDFGFAHAVEGEAGPDGGTPAYMAPEHLEGGHVDARSDQYAFCASLYEAVSGERARTDGTIPRGSPVPATLRRIIVRGLARRPGDRWPTMEDLLAALGRDRAKVPRRVAFVAAGVLAVVATAAAGDWVLRARLHAAAHAAFAATRAQVSHALALRHEAFSTLADLSLQVPILREVAGTKDLSDLGLGSRERDARDLATLHASLRDADWNAWASSVDRGHMAVADYKGRLLYATADREKFGRDVRGLGSVAAAYQSASSAMEVLPASDPRVGTLGLAPRPGLLLVFARPSVSGSVPQAMFIQAIDGRRLLDDLTPGTDVRLSLLAADGTAEGDVPTDLLGQVAADEVDSRGAEWFVQSVPLPGAVGAAVVMARRADAGLAGLFPHARTVLASLGGAALLLLLGSLVRVQTVARERRSISVRLSPPRLSRR